MGCGTPSSLVRLAACWMGPACPGHCYVLEPWAHGMRWVFWPCHLLMPSTGLLSAGSGAEEGLGRGGPSPPHLLTCATLQEGLPKRSRSSRPLLMTGVSALGGRLSTLGGPELRAWGFRLATWTTVGCVTKGAGVRLR